MLLPLALSVNELARAFFLRLVAGTPGSGARLSPRARFFFFAGWYMSFVAAARADADPLPYMSSTVLMPCVASEYGHHDFPVWVWTVGGCRRRRAHRFIAASRLLRTGAARQPA